MGVEDRGLVLQSALFPETKARLVGCTSLLENLGSEVIALSGNWLSRT